MATAYILITTDSGTEKRVAEELALMDGIDDADIVYGEYDIIAKIRLDDVSQLTDFIISKIRPLQGVLRTSTLIVAKD